MLVLLLFGNHCSNPGVGECEMGVFSLLFFRSEVTFLDYVSLEIFGFCLLLGFQQAPGVHRLLFLDLMK